MLLQPAPSIHTAFMQFPIDVVFMDGTLRVLKIVEQMPPWRAASKRHAWATLELAAGEVARRGIEVGDQVGVVQITDKLGVVEPGDWASVALGPARRQRRYAADDDAAGPLAPKATTDANRVLVVGTDRRFRSVAASLLSSRGCAVTLRDRMTDVAELAKREGAEVVVLDAGMSLTAAALEAAQIEALDPPVGIVVVGDEPEESLSAMPVLEKWGSFDDLFHAVEQARLNRGNGIAFHGQR
jgi:CheY-like chemotaxis protein